MLIPSTVSQGGTVDRKMITWMAPADADEFTAEFTTQTLKSSAVRIRGSGNAIANFPPTFIGPNAAPLRKQASGSDSVRLLKQDKGNVELIYNGNAGDELEVPVGVDAGINADDWDPNGTDIQLYDGTKLIATIPAPGPAATTPTVHIYPFAEANLVHAYKAVQGSVSRQCDAQGVPIAQILYAGGEAIVGDPVQNHGRQLRTGHAMADGELARDNSGFTELHFGSTGGAIFRYTTGGRHALKNGATDADVYGQIDARRLIMPAGSKTVATRLKTIDVSGYDPATHEVNFGSLSGTVNDPQDFKGIVRLNGPTTINGAVTMDNCLIYADGDATFTGGVSGIGAIVGAHNLTFKGQLHLTTDDVVAIACRGDLTLQP